MKNIVNSLVPRSRFQFAIHYVLWMCFIISLYVLQKYLFDGGLEYGYVQPLRTVFVIATPCLLIGLTLASKLDAQKTEIARLASTDALTGLLNRRAMDVLLETGLNDRLGSLLLIDVDHFKSINDRFGHSVGDVSLCAVAEVLRSELPQDVHVARWGGEEFIALAPSRQVEAMTAYAQRIANGVLIRIDDLSEPIRITLSLGLVGLAEAGKTDAILKLADKRLYSAKSFGRAQWVGPEQVASGR